MALNQKQIDLHWREFAAAKRACAAAGHPEPDRHTLYIQAGVVENGGAGVPASRAKSLTKFNNGDLDKVLAAFRAISQPANFNAQVAATEQPRVRLEYSIRELASQITERPVHIADAYWQAVFRDMFWGGGLNPENPGQPPDLALLTVQELEWLRNRLQEILEGRPSRRSQSSQTSPTSPTRQTNLIPADDNVPF